MFTYCISSGRLTHDKVGLIAVGYAGRGKGLNQPSYYWRRIKKRSGLAERCKETNVGKYRCKAMRQGAGLGKRRASGSCCCRIGVRLLGRQLFFGRIQMVLVARMASMRPMPSSLYNL